jgi:serine/threonine protein phosphatase PrpC
MYYDPQLRVGVFGCSRQGASHKRSVPPIPCQDAFHFSSGTLAGEAYLVAAVADGHGDKKYERSSIGSHLAAQAAYNVFVRFLWSKDGNVPFNDTSEDKSSIVRCFRDDFASGLLKEWKSLVKEHLECFPHSTFPAVPEASQATPVPYQLYGTTLLFAAVIENVVLLAKIGDGDVVILKKDGSYEVPPELAEDPRHVGGATDSLSSPDAAIKIKTWIRQGADYISTIKAITLSSDGLSNAVADDNQFHSLLSQIINRMTVASAQYDLPDIFDRFSQKGSGDDVTLLGLCFDESTIEVPQKTSEVQQADDATLPPDSDQLVIKKTPDSDSVVGAGINASSSVIQPLLNAPPLELQNPPSITIPEKAGTLTEGT